MAKAKPKQNSNADLIKAVQDHTDQIMDFYEKVEYDQPVILLDFQASRSKHITTRSTGSGSAKSRKWSWTRNTRRLWTRTRFSSSCGTKRLRGS